MYVKLEWFTGTEYAEEWAEQYTKRYYDLIENFGATEADTVEQDTKEQT